MGITDVSNDAGRAAIRRSRPERLWFVGLNIMMVGVACGLVALGLAIGVIATGLFVRLDLYQVGLASLLVAAACPAVALVVIDNLLQARRPAFVVAFLICLATPALELWTFTTYGRSAWPLERLTGPALVVHLIAVTWVISTLILLSPATLWWVAHACRW